MNKPNPADRIKAAQEKIKAQPAATPMQETKPVKQKATKEDTYHLNAFIPKDLATEVKIKLLREGKSLTDLVTEKLRQYLNE